MKITKTKLMQIVKEEIEVILNETAKVDSAASEVSTNAFRIGTPDQAAELLLKALDDTGLPDDNAKSAAIEMTMSALQARVEKNRQEKEIQAAQAQQG